MKNIIFPLLLFSFSFMSSQAASISLPNMADTTNPAGKPYKINEKEFMAQYGSDDTSKALIHYFFDKRTKASRMFYVPLILDGLAALVLGISGAFATVSMAYPLALLVFILAATTLALFIVGVVYLLKYSRKKLFRLINRYQSGGSIPKKIRGNKYFKFLLLKYR